MADIERNEYEVPEHLLHLEELTTDATETPASLDIDRLSVAERVLMVELGAVSIEKALGSDWVRMSDGILSEQISEEQMQHMMDASRS